jgi:hypothetical protein
VTSRCPEIPAAADEVFARALAKTPAGRYQSCTEFADSLAAALGRTPQHAYPRSGAIPHYRAPQIGPASGLGTVRPDSSADAAFARTVTAAQAPAEPRAEADRELRRQRRAKSAEHLAKRPAKIKNRAAASQTNAAAHAAIRQAEAVARQQRKAAFKRARGPYRWPEWSLIAGLIAFIAWLVLVVMSNGTLNGPAAAAVPMFLIWVFAVFIAGPAVLWRRHKAKKAAAALVPAAYQPESQGHLDGH